MMLGRDYEGQRVWERVNHPRLVYVVSEGLVCQTGAEKRATGICFFFCFVLGNGALAESKQGPAILPHWCFQN